MEPHGLHPRGTPGVSVVDAAEPINVRRGSMDSSTETHQARRQRAELLELVQAGEGAFVAPNKPDSRFPKGSLPNKRQCWAAHGTARWSTPPAT